MGIARRAQVMADEKILGKGLQCQGIHVNFAENTNSLNGVITCDGDHDACSRGITSVG